MKILIDIGHPAHIYFFKNCARILQDRGHKFLFVVRERDSTIDLIKSTGFDYVSRGKGGQGLIQKMVMIPKIDKILFDIAKKFKPDIFLSFSSYNADYLPFAHTIAEWTIKNMQDKKGYFYYRKFKYYINKIPYIRWSQAWMLLALITYINNSND